MGYHIQNKNNITKYIKGFADGNYTLAKLMVYALSGPLQHHHTTLKEITKEDPRWGASLKEQFNKRAKEKWYKFTPNNHLDTQIIEIRDWLAGALSNQAEWLNDTNPKGKPNKFETLQSLDALLEEAEGALTLSDEEMIILQQQWSVHDEDKNRDIKTIMNLNNGHRIVQLLTPAALKRESAFMGHCIGNKDTNTTYLKRIKKNDPKWKYYSLRNEANTPRATMEIYVPDNRLDQCKGKQNLPPNGKYLQYTQKFIKKRHFKLNEDSDHTGLIYQDGNYYDIFNLPKGFEMHGDYIVKNLKRAPSMPQRIKGNLELYNTNITDLGQLISVGGYLDLKKTNITNLGQLTSVGGNLYLEKTNITDLGQLTSVGKGLYLRGANITNLGQLTSVGGYLDLEGTNITDLGQLTSVGGTINTDIGRFDTLEEAKIAFAEHYGAPDSAASNTSTHGELQPPAQH